MNWNLPNSLTVLRIALIPVMVVVYFLPIPWREETVTTIFVLAAVTDWLDGHLARRMNIQSAFGAFLDPVADKLIVATALVLLVSDVRVLGQVLVVELFIIAVAVIIGREIVISALREWMAEIGRRASVKVGMLGKVKTTVQMIAISLLLYTKPLAGLPVFRTGEILFYLAALLTLWSMVEYLRTAGRVLQEVPEGAAGAEEK